MKLSLDFSVPPWFLPTIFKIVGTRGILLNYMVLRPSLEVCEQRASGRTDGVIADYAGFRDIYHSFDKTPKHIISDDESSAADLAVRIREEINRELFRVT